MQWRWSESLRQKRLLGSVTVAKRSFLWYNFLFEQMDHVRTAVHDHPQLPPKCGRPNRISFDVFDRCFYKVETMACETLRSWTKGPRIHLIRPCHKHNHTRKADAIAIGKPTRKAPQCGRKQQQRSHAVLFIRVTYVQCLEHFQFVVRIVHVTSCWAASTTSARFCIDHPGSLCEGCSWHAFHILVTARLCWRVSFCKYMFNQWIWFTLTCERAKVSLSHPARLLETRSKLGGLNGDTV